MALILCLPLTLASQSYWLTGYYAGAEGGGQTPALIPWDKYTHVNHFAAHPGRNCLVENDSIVDQTADFVAAAHAHQKKALITILDGDKGVYLDCTSAENIASFVENLRAFVDSHGYDGIDLDWEAVPPESAKYITHYEDLIRHLRAAMPNKIITTAVYWNAPGHALERTAGESQASLDRINVMCYDMDHPRENYAWYVDALWPGPSDPSCEAEVGAFTSYGVPKDKIIVGFPFYGRAFSNTIRPGNTSLLSKATTVYHRQLTQDGPLWQERYKHFDRLHGANYLSIPERNEFITYAGVDMIDALVQWVEREGFGGIMTFATNYEFRADLKGDCRYPLTTRLHARLFEHAASPADLGLTCPGGN